MNVAAILNEKGRQVVTAGRKQTILEIAQRLSEAKIGSVIITDDKDAVVGIVSERDIVRHLGTSGQDVLNRPVETCMTTNVISCQESDTIEEIMAQMTSRRFRHMPVVEDNNLVGLVSIGDVVKFRIAEAEMEADAMRQYISAV